MIKVIRYGDNLSEPSETDTSGGKAKLNTRIITGSAGQVLAFRYAGGELNCGPQRPAKLSVS